MSDDQLPAPRGSWSPARRAVRRFLSPVQRFLAVEAASGVVLIAAAALALVLANSPARDLVERLWSAPLGLTLGPWSFARDLRWWVNDGLMTVFFFVVGLEIRRELHAGELSDLRRAALPLAAALGGMMVPAAIYAAFNAGHAGAAGWGVPMATDIAFAVGVLALLGDRVAPALRILLLALAVLDDLGAILVIAVFYAGGVEPAGLAVAGLGLAGVGLGRLVGARSAWAYAPGALLLWAGTYVSGVHPTIAGVALGLLTPVEAWLGPARFAEAAEAAAREVRRAGAEGVTDLHEHLATVDRAVREAVSPIERLLHSLHGAVAFGVMPLFALANAGVALGAASLEGDGGRVFVGVFVGLVVGKAVGVWGLARLAAAAGVAAAPRGVSWRDVSVVGVVAGIGFTMALFVAQLAFPPGPLLETAKLGVLSASLVAGIGAWGWGWATLRRRPEAAPTEAAAEASTEV